MLILFVLFGLSAAYFHLTRNNNIYKLQAKRLSIAQCNSVVRPAPRSLGSVYRTHTTSPPTPRNRGIAVEVCQSILKLYLMMMAMMIMMTIVMSLHHTRVNSFLRSTKHYSPSRSHRLDRIDWSLSTIYRKEFRSTKTTNLPVKIIFFLL